MSENDLVNATIKYLNLIGHFAYRTHNYPVYDQKLGMYRKSKNIKGLPDIHVCMKDGRYAVIETKDKTKQRPDQKIFQQLVESKKGFYLLAFSIDDVMKAFPNSGGYLGSLGL